MRLSLSSICLLALVALSQAAPGGRKVFAHYMLGLTAGQSREEWRKEIQDAKAVGIDGFALNAGPTDFLSEEQLGNAYSVAEKNGFKLFISFDMACCGPWSVDQLANWINKYSKSSAQFQVDGRPFVSTFEGPSFADSWAAVEDKTGDLYLVPDWTSLGPHGLGQHLSKIDGAFSWDAWPTSKGQKNPEADVAFKSVLGEKTYMMGVSPWFYTSLPQWSKNWLWSSDTLWFDRWEQVLTLLPDFVEIITWNDFGESHYMTGNVPSRAIVTGAQRYVEGVPHDAWQFVLPYYTASYKQGSRVPIQNEGAVFWYRTTPKNVCSDGGTTCSQNSGISATECVEDAVFVLTMSNTPTTVTVRIGGQARDFNVEAGPQMVKVPFDGKVGDVDVSMNGKSGKGPAPISASCPPSGLVNFNPVVAKAA